MKAIHAYLIFDGNAREAMTAYAEAFGAELKVMTFAESPVPSPPEAKNRVMHAFLQKGGAVLMASDAMPGMPVSAGNNVQVSLACETVEETERLYRALEKGGQVKMPLQETFWAARFGMVVDRFGIHWMFNCEKPH